MHAPKQADAVFFSPSPRTYNPISFHIRFLCPRRSSLRYLMADPPYCLPACSNSLSFPGILAEYSTPVGVISRMEEDLQDSAVSRSRSKGHLQYSQAWLVGSRNQEESCERATCWEGIRRMTSLPAVLWPSHLHPKVLFPCSIYTSCISASSGLLPILTISTRRARIFMFLFFPTSQILRTLA